MEEISITDQEIIDLLNCLKVGDKINVTIESFMGELVKADGMFMGNLIQHGYYFKNGGWGLYSIKKHMPDKEELPCFQFDFKEKRKRNSITLKIGFDVKEIVII